MKVPACSDRLPTPPGWKGIAGFGGVQLPIATMKSLPNSSAQPEDELVVAGRCRGLVVDEEPVVEGKTLGVEHAGAGGAVGKVPNRAVLVVSKSASLTPFGPVQGNRAVLSTCVICSST